MYGMLEAVRGCLKEEVRMDIISNNLANATSIGFKKDRISFQDLLSEKAMVLPNGKAPVRPSPSPALVRIETDLTQGVIRHTGNDLDLAISGSGFFKVMTPDGIRYTRKGSFNLDSQGNLVTQEGHPVMGKNGVVNPGDRGMVVDAAGRVFAEGSEVDQLVLVEIQPPEHLVKEGASLFKKTPEGEERPLSGEATVRQGYVEEANVNVAEEMVNMIHAMRAFESYQKAVQVLDRLDNKATNEVGRLR
jgi:flagellar basal-body rod protein FlgG